MRRSSWIPVAVLAVASLSAAPPQPLGEHRNQAEREQEFMDWGLGMFIHWGVDAPLGSVISHSLVGASDEYVDRYVNTLPGFFEPKDYDPEEWVKLAKLAGFRYMVLTTKHHSGFCLWPTKTTDFSVAGTPHGKDVVGPFVEACRKHGMKVGFYFSPEDFHFLHRQGLEIRRRAKHADISHNPELLAHNQGQINELFTRYGPIDIVFLDAFDNAAIRDQIHLLQPRCLVTRGEMKTPEQKVPGGPLPGPWEACFTLGTQWQFKPTNENYKSGAELIEMLIDIRAKGGNLLINMGPEPSGRIPFEQERVFRELALWMFINGEAIHGTRPGPVVKDGDIWFSRCGGEPSTVYVFLPQGDEPWKFASRRDFLLKSLRATESARISVLGQNSRVAEYRPKANPEARIEQTAEGLAISVVRSQRIYNNFQWPHPLVAKLEGVAFTESPPAGGPPRTPEDSERHTRGGNREEEALQQPASSR